MLEEGEFGEEWNVGAGVGKGSIRLDSLCADWSVNGRGTLVDLTLEATSGQLVGIIGPVGSGKVRTTFLTISI